MSPGRGKGVNPFINEPDESRESLLAERNALRAEAESLQLEVVRLKHDLLSCERRAHENEVALHDRVEKLRDKLWSTRADLDILYAVARAQIRDIVKALEKLAQCSGGCDGPMGCMCKAPIARECLARIKK